MTDKYFLVVSSKDSLQFFPNNKPTYFTTVLSTPLDLSGSWSIGLTEIVFDVIQPNQNNHNLRHYLLFDVYLSQSSGCLLAGIESMLLRRFFHPIKKGETTVAVDFTSVNMMPLKSAYLDRLEIIIKPVDNENILVNEQVTAHATLILQH